MRLAVALALRSCPQPGGRSRNLGSERVALTLVNAADQDLVVRWVDFEGVLREIQGELVPPGAEHQQHTFPGHLFEVRDTQHELVDLVEVPAGEPTRRVDVTACEGSADDDERRRWLTQRLAKERLPPKRQPVDLDAFVVTDLECDPQVPSKDWVCVQDAPPRRSWKNAEYGFQAGDIDFGQTGGLMVRKPGDTECGESIGRFGHVPHFSKSPDGILVMKMPDQLWEAVQYSYHWFDNTGAIPKEEPPGGGFSNAGPDRPWEHRSLDHLPRYRDWIGEFVNDMAEWWSLPETGKSRRSSTYGWRVYGNDAMLINHRDVENTHVLSAVLCVDADLDEGWPLLVERKEGSNSTYAEYKEVYLKPGYMVLYEGARYMHGRPKRFTGRHFAAGFVHSTPLKWLHRNDAKPKKRSSLATRGLRAAADWFGIGKHNEEV